MITLIKPLALRLTFSYDRLLDWYSSVIPIVIVFFITSIKRYRWPLVFLVLLPVRFWNGTIFPVIRRLSPFKIVPAA